MLDEEAVDGQIEVRPGSWPLSLPQLVAAVGVVCPRCDGEQTQQLTVGAHWWDRAALAQQRDHAFGLRCRLCGGQIDLPVPLVQHRSLDAVDVLIALPPETPADRDRSWIRAIIARLRTQIGSPTAVAVRASWWAHVDTVPLGPVLAGLSGPPDLPEPLEERHRWLESTRAALALPDIPAAVARFASADTVTDARQVTRETPDLLEPKWRNTVELAGSRLMHIQETEEQREVVEQRLSRLRQIATNLEADTRADHMDDLARSAVDRAIALPSHDPARRQALDDAVAALRPQGPSRTLAAAMTSQLANRLADPGRTPADWSSLVALANESSELSRQVFGPAHDATIMNVMNTLLLHQERPDLTVEGAIAVCAEYERLAQDADVRRTGHLIDILNNLATALSSRSDLSRGERQELVLQLFEDTEHITRLCHPSDTRTIVLALVNQAAVLRQRIAGARRLNADRAWSLLTQAQQLQDSRPVLQPIELVQLETNRLNLGYTLFSLGSPQFTHDDLLAAARQTSAAIAALHPDNETAIAALLNAGAVLVDAHIHDARRGLVNPSLLSEAEQLLESASERADRLYPAGHRTRLTARLNLAAVYGAPNGAAVTDAVRCADLLTDVAAEAQGHSADHIATAMTNLGTLRIGQGRWEDAAEAYATARQARNTMLAQAAGRHTQLGEVIAAGDLATREALAYAKLSRHDRAIAALESNRANLLRHRRGISGSPEPAMPTGRAVIHLSSCSLGTLGVVVESGRPPRSFVLALSAAAVRDVLRSLVTARTRLDKMLGFEAAADLLRGLIDTVSSMLASDITELCVVACGPLAGAPLHAIPDTNGRTWAHWGPVRYWPSAAVAAFIGEPDLACIKHAVAVTDPTRDLPLSGAELNAVQSLAEHTTTPPIGWSVAAWLRSQLPTADLAHFACHGRTDLVDPTGSHFQLAQDEQLSVDDLLEGPYLTRLQLVVASACQAGVPAEDAPDELLGIGYGLVHAGATAAITTLWEVNDVPAALLIARLYQELILGHHPATGLHRAQRWLADIDNRHLRQLCISRLGGEQGDTVGWLPVAVARGLEPQLAAADPDDRPFQHPADWAAFTYLGA